MKIPATMRSEMADKIFAEIETMFGEKCQKALEEKRIKEFKGKSSFELILNLSTDGSIAIDEAAVMLGIEVEQLKDIVIKEKLPYRDIRGYLRHPNYSPGFGALNPTQIMPAHLGQRSLMYLTNIIQSDECTEILAQLEVQIERLFSRATS